MKKLVLNIFVLLLVGVLMSGLGSGAVLDQDFNDVKWEAIDFVGSGDACSGYTKYPQEGGCASYRYDGWNGNFIGCDGYTKKGCNDYSSGSREICTIASNSADCSYVACTSRVCAYYSARGQCGSSLSNGTCSGALSCYANCSVNQACTQTSQCQSGMICSSNSCVFPKLNVTYWANIGGEKITNSQQGDSVFMVNGGYLLTDKTINYTVQEWKSEGWNLFTWWSKRWNDANKIYGKAVQEWVVPTDNLHTKRFIASINGTSISNASDVLYVLAYANSQPDVAITYPHKYNNLDFANFSVGFNIPFQQTSTDDDDLLKITWDFGDETNHVVENYSSWLNTNNILGSNKNHSFEIGGRFYDIKLTAEEMRHSRSNPKSDSDSVRVYVFQEGVNIVPVLTGPKNGESYGIKWVQFNASQTYVANCTTRAMASPDFKTADNLLNCTYLHAPGKTSTSSNYNLTFNWDIGDGNLLSGDLNKNYNTTVVFKHRYSTAGRHVVKLNVRYTE